MNEYLQIVILAIIQSVAEMLPVSSTAHVIVAEKLMGLDPSSPKMVFVLVMLHTGTMIAVLCFFWSRWRARLFANAGSPASGAAAMPRLHFLKMVIAATLCTGLLGLGLMYLIEKVIFVKVLGQTGGRVEDLFKNLPLIAGSLFAVGLLILAAGSRETRSVSTVVTLRSSIWIGIVQGLCLPLRGFSRSGATISTGLFLGMSRALAEDFSFALAVAITPAIIGKSVLGLLKEREQLGSVLTDALMPGLLGMLFSFAGGLVALQFLSAALEKGRWRYFGIYCLFAAAAVLAVWRYESDILRWLHGT